MAAPSVKGMTFNDVRGKHLLLLTKRSGPSKTMPDPHREERHELKAIQFAKTAKSWVEEWVITDHVDCPSLDSEANFYLDQVSITDVNNDGHAEVSVPYKLFCEGGVDPKIIKIIMRTKRQKFALRGMSKIVSSGSEPLGGQMEVDTLLKRSVNAAYKDHLTKIWNAIYIERH